MVGRKAGVYIQGVRSLRASHEPGRKHPWWMDTKRSSTYKLLKVGEADVGESKLLDVEYGAIRLGTKGGGKGPNTPERQRTSYDKELEAAKKLGEEMFDLDGRMIAGLRRARSARGTEPQTHRIWSTSFPLVVT